MTSENQTMSTFEPTGGSLRNWMANRPILAFLLLVAILDAVAVGAISALAQGGVLTDADMRQTAYAFFMVWFVLLPSTVCVTWACDGRLGLKDLLRRAFRWKFPPLWWLLIVATPFLTIAFAFAIGGTLKTSEIGALIVPNLVWFISAVLVVNLVEETVWAGFFQTRLEREWGLVAAALFTALPFIGVHIPLLLLGDFTNASLLLDIAILLGFAPLARLHMGATLRGARDSLLAAGILHASWNLSYSDKRLVDELVALPGDRLDLVYCTAASMIILTIVSAFLLRSKLGKAFRVAQQSK